VTTRTTNDVGNYNGDNKNDDRQRVVAVLVCRGYFAARIATTARTKNDDGVKLSMMMETMIADGKSY
jgi:hypothetical protein